MDVLRVNPSTYLPDSLVEGYESMIWTERYQASGEFEMVTARIKETRGLIPEKSLLTLMDTDEIMVVETHNIKVDDRGNPKLTVKGRTFEVNMENRALSAEIYGQPWQTPSNYKTSEMAAALLWNHLVNGTGQDITKTGVGQDTLTAVSNLVVTDSTTLTEAAKEWWLESGEAYQKLLDFLTDGKLGIRNIRPSSDGNVMTFSTAAGTRGAPTKTPTNGITQLRVDIYNGVDRTMENSIDPIIFHYDSGHIDNPEYLFSVKDYKNVAHIVSSIGDYFVYENGTTTPPTPNPSGLDRRVLFVDGGDIGSTDALTFEESIVQKARIELAKHNWATLFDGAVSPVSPYKYNEDYKLGDIVTLLAQYGFVETMRVMEYVRTEDIEGDRGYPTLMIDA